MYCIQCGARLGQTGKVATQPLPTNPVPPPRPPHVPSYMTQSVLMTLCCCLPIGIVCIIKANKVNRLLRMNDYEGAEEASDSNRTWLWVGFVLGLLLQIFAGAARYASQN